MISKIVKCELGLFICWDYNETKSIMLVIYLIFGKQKLIRKFVRRCYYSPEYIEIANTFLSVYFISYFGHRICF